MRVSAGATWNSLGDVVPGAASGKRGKRSPLLTNTELAIEFAVQQHARGFGLANEGLASSIARGREAINKGAALCESPIEIAVLPWLVFGNYDLFLTFPAALHDPKADRSLPIEPVLIVPQFAFIKFRVDFALVGRWKGQTKIVAIECDGAAFHGAAVDRKRDAYLSAFGIETVRAMGSDIRQDPRQLTSRAARLLIDWAVQL